MVNPDPETILNHEPKSLRKILKDILTRISPTQEENRAINEIVANITDVCQKIAYQDHIPLVDVVHVGSSSRGTHLRGDTDIDVFLRFNCQTKKELEEYLKLLAPKLEQFLHTRITWKYSENPYLHFPVVSNNITFSVDVVGTAYIRSPSELTWALKLGGMARTPFHSRYLDQNLTPQLKASIRLFKYWLKLKKCYGTGGITGFLAELLIIYTRGFIACLDFMAKRSLKGLHLDMENHYPFLDAIKKKFPHDQCVIIDPIDPNRNAAAGIQGFYSKFVLTRLHQEAQNTIANPLSELQREVKPNDGWIKINVIFTKNPVNEDEQFLRLARIARMITAQLDKRGFWLQDVLINAQANEVFLKFNANRVPWVERRGPPLTKREEVKKFKEKNQITFERDGRVWARIKNNPEDVVSWLKANSSQVQEKVGVKITITIIGE